MDETTALREAEAFLTREVRPRAHEIDRDPAALGWALQGLRERRLMALRRPAAWGGPGLDEPAFRRFQVVVARASGALAFLQQQHQSAVKMIAAGGREALQRAALPEMDGARLMGIGYSQLRRPGAPLVRATPAPEGAGYVVDGVVPWVTGVGFYPEFLLGAELPDGRALFGVVPLAESEREGGRVRVGAPIALAALEVAQTSEVRLDRWPLRPEEVARVEPAGWMRARDASGVAGKSWLILGCARGAADVLAEQAPEAGAAVHAQLDEAQRRLLEAEAAPLEAQAAARAHLVALAGRAAHAAVAAAGGSANLRSRDAQRVYREVLMFTVLGQTPAVRDATVAALVPR